MCAASCRNAEIFALSGAHFSRRTHRGQMCEAQGSGKNALAAGCPRARASGHKHVYIVLHAMRTMASRYRRHATEMANAVCQFACDVRRMCAFDVSPVTALVCIRSACVSHTRRREMSHLSNRLTVAWCFRNLPCGPSRLA